MKKMPARIIARLDIKGPNLVKGIHLEGLRALGDPDEFAEYYCKQGVDELFYMDVVASLYDRNSLVEMISRIAKKIFIPLAVGGGIRTFDDINHVLRAGADKVCVNTAAIKNPDFIKQAIKKFGSSTIMVAIEAQQQKEGGYLAYTDNGREFTGIEVVSWAKQLNEMGVGEIVITSIDKEGTGLGYDLNLVKKITNSVDVPVVVHGGAGCFKDVVDLFCNANVSAVAIASIFHYHFINQIRNVSHINTEKKEGNFNFLESKENCSKITSCDPIELKQALSQKGIFCRL